MENENVTDISEQGEVIPGTIEETVDVFGEIEEVFPKSDVTFTKEELEEIEDVLLNGSDETFMPPEAIIGLDTGIPGGDSSPMTEEEKMDLIAKLEELQHELEEADDHMFEEKLAAETAAMDAYIDGMFHMTEIQELLQANSTNIFSNEVLAKFDKLLLKMRNLISKERNKFNKTLVKQNHTKKDREQMLKIFFNQTKPLREDINKLAQLVMELKRTRKVIKEEVQKRKQK